jgi:shikimate kinase
MRSASDAWEICRRRRAREMSPPNFWMARATGSGVDDFLLLSHPALWRAKEGKIVERNIVLVGLPSCGKTTLGKQAADLLGMDFVDTDAMTSARLNAEGFPWTRIFSARGQDAFLRAQREVIENLRLLQKPTIIATGAEASLSPENLPLLREAGIIIHIHRDFDIIMAHLRNKHAREGSLQLVNVDTGQRMNLHETGMENYRACLPRYDSISDLSIENHGEVSEGVAALVKAIRAYDANPRQ